MKSMTGFGRSEEKNNSFSCIVEISSVNRKNLDVKISSEENLIPLEIIIRKLIAEKFSRGMINLKITLNSSAEETLTTIQKKFEEIFLWLEKIRRKLKINEKISVSDLINLYSIAESHSQTKSCLPDKLILSTVSKAVHNLDKMRATEGENLKNDIGKRLNYLSNFLSKIEKEIKHTPKKRKEILLEKLKALELELDINDERILKEIAIFAEKSDVTEEITRLKSHFSQFKGILNSNGEIGRKLDFLTQEIQREISTLSTKSTPSRISPLVIEFKSELEKIREQIQNIE